MTSALDRIRKNKSSNLEKLQNIVEETKSRKDTRIWQPKLGADKTTSALIRFLPPPDMEERGTPWSKHWSHAFQNKKTGLWYWEKSRTTLGKDKNDPEGRDPVSDLNTKLYQSSEDPDSPARQQASEQKRVLHIMANIYVIEDENNPENNGKVFLYKITKNVFEMIHNALAPKFADDRKLNPFDFDEGGASFRIRGFEKSAGKFTFIDYSKSSFNQEKPLFDNDEELEKVLAQTYSLKEFDDPSTFKSYGDLERRLNVVLGITKEGKKEVNERSEAPKELRTAKAPDTSKQESPQEERSDPGNKTMSAMGDERPTPPPAEPPTDTNLDEDDDKLASFFAEVKD